MAKKSTIEVEIKGKDKASPEFKKVGVSADKMAANFAKAGAGMIAVGAAIVGSMVSMVNSFTKAGDEIAKMAKRTGISTEALSEMRHVAQLSGTDLGAFEKAIRTMQGAILDGQEGLETYIRAFERIGINVNDLKGMKPEDQFWAIADGLAAMSDETVQAATASDIFGGRVGTQLIPMLESGTEAIADMKEEAHKLNLVFSEESAKAAEDFEDAKTRLTGSLNGIKFAIAEGVLPVMQEWVDMMVVKLQPTLLWLKEHPEVSESFLKFGLLFAAGGVIMLGIAGFIKLLNFAMIPAILKAVVAFIAFWAAAGPKGWAVLAASVGVAAGTIYAFKQALGELGEELANLPTPGQTQFDIEYQNMLDLGYTKEEIEEIVGHPIDMKHGGIVPGPIGQPVPIIAHGGEEFLGVGQSSSPSTNIMVGTLLGDEASLRRFARMVKTLIGEENRRNTFGPINRGYFSGRSSI